MSKPSPVVARFLEVYEEIVDAIVEMMQDAGYAPAATGTFWSNNVRTLNLLRGTTHLRGSRGGAELDPSIFEEIRERALGRLHELLVPEAYNTTESRLDDLERRVARLETA